MSEKPMSVDAMVAGMGLRGAPVLIPNTDRNDLPEFLVARGYRTGVEVGVLKGQFTAALCGAGLHVYGIDPWMPYGEEIHADRMDYIYGRAQRVARKFCHSCKLIRKASMEAVGDFEDGSLDFVYIDGNHEFRYVAEDIYEWPRKVRMGGAVIGHDYWNDIEKRIHCGAVVDAYTKLFGVSNWYLFGNPRWRKLLCWMFIKQETT